MIYFAHGFEAEARRLATRLGESSLGELTVALEPTALPSADVRIVLGHDALPGLALLLPISRT